MSYPAYPEYKESGVDWLEQMPSHWTVKRLRHVTDLNPGKSKVRGYDPDMETTFLPMEAVGEDGSLDLVATRPLSDVIDGYTYFQEDDVAYAKITPCFENGKAATMRGLKNGIGFGTTELTVLRPHTDQTTPDYLFRVITSEPFRSLGESSMYGAGGQKRVPDDFARNFSIPWPPLPEQTQIARFLDHQTTRIDALIAEQRRLIELLKEKRQAVISHAVTKGLDPDVAMRDSGVEWLGEVPAHWQVKRLKHVTSVIGGATPSKDRADFWDGSIPWVSPKDMKVKVINQTIDQITEEAVLDNNLSLADPGMVLIVVRGMILAHSLPLAITAFKVALNQDMKALKAENYINSEYLFEILSGIQDIVFEFVDSSAHGTRRLEWERFREILLPIPPLSEQRELSYRINAAKGEIDQLSQEARKAIGLLQERRSALVSAAVTGKIDVRDWQPQSSENCSDAFVGEGATA